MAGKQHGSAKGERRGGRQKGVRNKATIEREEKAKAEIAAAVKNATKSSANPKYAMEEMYKAISIAEGVAGKLQPKDISADADGKIVVTGGDLKSFGEWYDRWFKCIETLAKYQIPAIKPIEVPAPPPDPADLERKSRKRFGLRIFEGGRAIRDPTEDPKAKAS